MFQVFRANIENDTKFRNHILIDAATLKKIWAILSPVERKKGVHILWLMLVGMLLETLGIGLVIPTLAVMTRGNIESRYPALAPTISLLGHPSNEKLVIWGMVILVTAYLIKTLFLGFLAWRQMGFVFGVQTNLSQRLFTGYLQQPYCFHLQRNSAELIRNITNEATLFSQSGFLSAMVLITESLVVAGVTALLVWIEPVGAILIVSALGMVTYLFNAVTKKNIMIWGEQRQYHDGQRIQSLQEGLGGVKDVKLLGCDASFLNRHLIHGEEFAHAGRKQATLLVLPRLFLELFAVIGIAALVIVMLFRGRSPESLLPILGLFAAAAFRVMPSFTRIMGAIQNMQYALPVVNTIYSELESFQDDSLVIGIGRMDLKSEIQLEKVVFQYPGAASKSIDQISLSIAKGSFVGFIGGSGAGKSTLVDILLGLLTPTSGAVKVDGQDIQENLRAWQSRIGYVPQTIFLTDNTLRSNIAFGVPLEMIDETSLWGAVKSAQLEAYITSLPHGIDTLVGERGVRLSGGQRQRIGIARALYHNPEILVLDEATSSLDIYTERLFMESVRKLHGKKTIIIVAHRLSTVENCDMIFHMDKGKLTRSGAPKEIL